MEVSRIRALRGPNLWSRNTAIEAIVACSGTESCISEIPDFEVRLRARFPEIGYLQPAGHEGGVSIAHVLEVAALSLQKQAGCIVTFSRTVQTIEKGTYQVVFEYGEEAVGRLALEIAQELCLAAKEDAPFDLDAALNRLRELDEDERLGPSTGSIVYAALARGIPYRRLTSGSMVQLGWGSKQRRIQAAETDGTSAIAQSIAQDKELTKKLLDAAGVPIPFGRPVQDEEDAWAAALEIGLPIVVKPQDGNQGKGVTVNVVSREHLRIAYAAAEAVSSSVMIERYLPGHDYRLLVVGGKVVAAARRDPPQVIGDGVHSVRELVDIVNSDPRRSEGHATALTKIRLDTIALARLDIQGFSVDSIPPKGSRVILRNNANLSTGGSATDVTDDVHAEVAARAVAAAQMIDLDICGVDVVCDSLLKPLEEQGGGVIEVNAAPGLRMHLQPSYGKARAVGEAIVSSMFNAGDNARIPLVAVSGTNGKTTTVRLIAHLLGQNGLRVGMTNSDGVYIDGQRIDSGDCSGPKSARNVLLHPDVDAAVFETARGGVLREGLAFDRCDVAVVTNIGIGDHLGLNYIHTVDDLAVVKRVVVQNVTPTGTAVLNAADPMVVKMAGVCPGAVTFFASDLHHPVMATHRAKGLPVVYVEGGEIVAAEGAMEQRIALQNIPLTRNGTIGFQVENAMAAIAAGWALGLDWKLIRAGVATFINDAATAPGRFNVYDYRGATLIADYGHNPDAILALVSAIDNMPAKRRIVVISGAGDRRDVDISQQTEILGNAFDEVILYQDQCQRGRADGEVLSLLRQGLAKATRTKVVEEIRGEFPATDLALSHLAPGDLCLILIDQVDEALAYIEKRIAEA
ncbi:MAG: cyanophycin synthetase [Gallionellales bacterium 35-53-114]|jgi:cyanophycin synthetase|nr:MAG: cyanophycin synthetase [Gallionellales bacterium 35-53-114]OYZ65273.1 MAG: cyanophycin synthetase [Gallionellales bacterium 24-53-125]OZB08179.1 MAG: cyanophycin synthetase [Gallionellales bacterium 39-52-133]HQS58106.1 cyanophycin synthetase [Gallionellaceae bacterium]HQS73661.1 cyanophycin synthetase [Gallionellaceae bacterium]